MNLSPTLKPSDGLPLPITKFEIGGTIISVTVVDDFGRAGSCKDWPPFLKGNKCHQKNHIGSCCMRTCA